MHTLPSRRCPNVLLLLLLLTGAGAHARAETVYKCRDAAGHVAYQDRACAANAQGSRVAITPAPPRGPSPDYGVPGPRLRAQRKEPHASPLHHRGSAGMSHECRVANGEIFYRHDTCPHSIKESDARGMRHGAGVTFAVSDTALSRTDACRRLAAAGSIGRAGHERDQRVSTYDRNAGRDPCR